MAYANPRNTVTKISAAGRIVTVSHCGRPGHTEETVRNAFDELYGSGAFDRVRPHGEYACVGTTVFSDPAYAYALEIPIAAFRTAIAGASNDNQAASGAAA